MQQTATRHDPALYRLQGVSKTYGTGAGTVHALREVDLTIGAGETVAVVGQSGSGKTTLLQLLGALDRPSDGTIHFEGRDLTSFRDGELTRLGCQTIGFVFQQFNLIPTLTAAQNVEVALVPAGGDAEERRSRVASLLEAVGLAGRAEHLPSQLSGGEQQRVAIARALANDPRVVLADEPTGNLDSSTGAEILTLLSSVAGENRSLILITHDPAVAARAERTVRLRDGAVETR